MLSLRPASLSPPFELARLARRFNAGTRRSVGISCSAAPPERAFAPRFALEAAAERCASPRDLFLSAERVPDLQALAAESAPPPVEAADSEARIRRIRARFVRPVLR
jgi:hypothetical protein